MRGLLLLTALLMVPGTGCRKTPRPSDRPGAQAGTDSGTAAPEADTALVEPDSSKPRLSPCEIFVERLCAGAGPLACERWKATEAARPFVDGGPETTKACEAILNKREVIELAGTSLRTWVELEAAADDPCKELARRMCGKVDREMCERVELLVGSMERPECQRTLDDGSKIEGTLRILEKAARLKGLKRPD